MPYQGYDSGPRFEPTVDPGCSGALPYYSPLGGGGCVECNTDQDCPSSLFCFLSRNVLVNACVTCRPDGDGGTVGCSAGEVCDLSNFFPGCIPDCRTSEEGCPAASFCSPDAGRCIPGCMVDSDCKDAGLCIIPGVGSYGCFACYGDAGCNPGELCEETSRWACYPNRADAGAVCAPNTMCREDIGLCEPGCSTDADCGDGTPVCNVALDPPICGQCGTAADCLSSMPGCFQTESCPSCALKCGGCVSDADCPAGLQCFDQTFCGCSGDADCAALAGAPVCLGLDAGYPAGSCGCLTSGDCGPGAVCDLRDPFVVHGESSVWASRLGGTCVPSCADAGADFCSISYGNPVCNPATGFCVPCLQDSDCTTGASQPWYTPSCIPFADGGLVSSYLPFVLTGGGQCGCRSTASCDDGLTCQDPSDAGQCIAPCSLIDEIDSCQPLFGGGFCNTFNGLCQQCLDDYGCTGVTDSTSGFPTPSCSGGHCIE